MTGREHLVGALKAFSDKEAMLRRESLFKVAQLQRKVDETFQVIAGWLAGIDGLEVQVVDGDQIPFLATVFHAKHLRITLAKLTVQFNPVATVDGLFFTIVGLKEQDIRMGTDFTLTLLNGSPAGSLEADWFHRQLADRVQHV